MVANWPYTALVIMPVNKQLMDAEPAAADAGTRQMIQSWGRLHTGRSGLGALATLAFLWALNT